MPLTEAERALVAALRAIAEELARIPRALEKSR